MKIYLMGSLRNPSVPSLGNRIRQLGYEVFDDWFAAGEKADDSWQEYEQTRGKTYKEALGGYAANHVFEYDKHHLDTADIGVLVMPCGKSGWLEFGYLVGKGKPCYALIEKEPERWDVMIRFGRVFDDFQALLNELTSILQ